MTKNAPKARVPTAKFTNDAATGLPNARLNAMFIPTWMTRPTPTVKASSMGSRRMGNSGEQGQG